jgi:hypothetical protein
MQVVPATHVLPHEPQLFGSVFTSVHVPLHTRLGDMQPAPLLELAVVVDDAVVTVDDVIVVVDVDDDVEVAVDPGAPAEPMVVTWPPFAVPTVVAEAPPPPKKPSPDGPGQPTTTAASKAAAAPDA